MQVKDLKQLNATEGRTYLVMVPHGWARDKNAFTAFKLAKGHMAYAPQKPTAEILDAPDDAWVDCMGTIRWADGDEKTWVVGQLSFSNR